jgi:hypothetical protein
MKYIVICFEFKRFLPSCNLGPEAIQDLSRLGPRLCSSFGPMAVHQKVAALILPCYLRSLLVGRPHGWKLAFVSVQRLSCRLDSHLFVLIDSLLHGQLRIHSGKRGCCSLKVFRMC